MSRLSRFTGALALLVGTTFNAHAVSLSPNGLGQVLIYPYYSVRNAPLTGSPYNSLLTVGNWSNSPKVVKLRVREALAGAPVFESVIFLGVFDVWTAAIVPVGEGAGLVSTDGTCSRPSVGPDAAGMPSLQGRFDSATYATDPIGGGIGRTREGFIEVLEMAVPGISSPIYDATMAVNGVAKCGDIPIDGPTILERSYPPVGGLYGSMTLVNVLEGTAYSYDAVALDNWSVVPVYHAPGTGRPTLADTNPPISTVVDGGRLLVSTWSTGIDAVNAVLAANTTQAEFMREAAVDGATDVVYTAPTKPLLVNNEQAMPPFSARLFSDGACEPALTVYYSRDQQVQSGQQDPGPARVLCWATTVQSFNSVWPAPTAVLGSAAGFRHTVDTSGTPLDVTSFESGVVYLWLLGTIGRQDLTSNSTNIVDLKTGAKTHSNNVTYRGIPLIGTSFIRYVNGALNVNSVSTLSNYGAGAAVRTSRSVTVGSAQ